MHGENIRKKIILTGGGTGGSVTPLLGIVDELKSKNIEFQYAWIGTRNGPEKQMIEREKIKFITISSGKWRRYLSLHNLADIIKLIIGFFQSLIILSREKADLVMSAGSYVSVPVAWAAWILRIPIFIHQLDAKAGLANKLMAPFAAIITTTLEQSTKELGAKAQVVGNSIRKEIKEIKIAPREAKQKLGLSSKLPVVLIMGGGTGAGAINKIVDQSAFQLTKFCEVIHITGLDKQSATSKAFAETNPNYRVFEFLDTFGMIKAYAAADVVVSRCGMATLSELSYLGKPAIIIPMPDSHQEYNAEFFAEQEAAVVLNQNDLNSEVFIKNIKNIIKNDDLRIRLHSNIQNLIKDSGNENIVDLLLGLLKHEK